MRRPGYHLLLSWVFSLTVTHGVSAQGLEDELRAIGTSELAKAARKVGDAKRGAVVFYQPYLACTRCHVADDGNEQLGPDLTAPREGATDEYLVESVLEPSKVIRAGFESLVAVSSSGQVLTGLKVRVDDKGVALRDAARNFKTVEIQKSDILQVETSKDSIMPAGQMNALTSKQQFLDLVRYLIEIRDGGASRARELEPDPSLYVARPLPEYESRVDHAGIIASLDSEAYDRGEEIYNRLCINCHGTHDQPGSLPTSLKFASGQFKNGNDPFAMYQTLTRGFGMMAAQTWMVPTQKYDVIHYVREAYLKKHNPSQYFKADRAYLDRLPSGDTRGPAPSEIVPWEQMDYGPNLALTLEVGDDATNFAYKGNAVRLDAGPGGVSQGRYWMLYDYDTLRVAAAWSGEGFIDWNGINFNERHRIHPRLVGDVHLANPTGPGWGRPQDRSFEDVRLVGRDGRIYGPLPRSWAQYKGMYYYGPHTLVEYTVGETKVLELPGVVTSTPEPVFTRTFNIGPRKEDLVLQVAHRKEPDAALASVGKAVIFGPPRVGDKPNAQQTLDGKKFGGATRVEVALPEGRDPMHSDFTVAARIKTTKDGTIFAYTQKREGWHHLGFTWFVRDGRLTVGVGWEGEFQDSRRVADGEWHDVAFSYQYESGTIRLYVDGRSEERTGRLKPREPLDEDPVLRIGFTADNYPALSYFKGEIANVRLYDESLGSEGVEDLANDLVADWNLAALKDGVVPNGSGKKFVGQRMERRISRVEGWTISGIEGETVAARWHADKGNLRLTIPAGDTPIKFTLWFASVDESARGDALAAEVVIDEPGRDLASLTKGGPSRWPQVLEAEAVIGKDDGPFAVDVLSHPEQNPWFCRMRLTGFDFTADGDQAIVSAWEGSIWRVSGLSRLPGAHSSGETGSATITWKRIASGLFQPLGVKIVDGEIYVTCRDQLCILHDLNGDGEIDYFQSFNNDHQVTDHFHEFAMGLQTDHDGNFYYAKSARHALTAVVPHHGTLLRVSKDGSRTDIVANGFRAANGVCLNPDGTFIVTDQEGHWNPKNRINYVKEGGFYGNMFGYHDVTDSSDDAMEQPLCWITNNFDRSPSELLWVDSELWGPLNKRLLNFSYGYGGVYIVPHEKIDGQAQGGMCELPIPRFPTGVMRGRFHPRDRQLYLCGMFAWAGSQTQPGGFYRLRSTGKPVYLPIDLKATKRGLSITFSGKLEPSSAGDAGRWNVKVWSLKRTAIYGSDHYDERALEVESARLDDDGRTVHLEIPDIAPTWCMEVRYRIRAVDGESIDGKIHNTIHRLGE